MSLGIGGIISLGGSTSGSGGGGGSSSGITTINPGNNQGPTVEFQGVNGITVTSPSTNIILINGVALSGTVTKFAASFTGITSGLFTHNLGTLDVIVQVRNGPFGGAKVLLPDAIIIENLNQVSLTFNRPQDGRVVII